MNSAKSKLVQSESLLSSGSMDNRFTSTLAICSGSISAPASLLITAGASALVVLNDAAYRRSPSSSSAETSTSGSAFSTTCGALLLFLPVATNTCPDPLCTCAVLGSLGASDETPTAGDSGFTDGILVRTAYESAIAPMAKPEAAHARTETRRVRAAGDPAISRRTLGSSDAG